MCSTKIQNDIIACITKFVRMKIIDIVEEKKHFSVIAVEVIGRYTIKEIVLLCLRYLNITNKIDVPVIDETFLDFKYVQGTPTGKVIGNHIPYGSDRQAERQTDKQIERQTDRQTDRQRACGAHTSKDLVDMVQRPLSSVLDDN